MIRRRAHVPDFENWLRLKQWAQANPTPALPINGLVELQAFHFWCIVQVRRHAQLQANHDRQWPQSTSQSSRKDPLYLKLLKHTSKTQAFSVDFHRTEQQTKALGRERDEANQGLSNMGKQLSKVQEELKNTQGQLEGLREEVRTLQARLAETSQEMDNDIETTRVHHDLL
jgi:chromosome segregation ATPase